MLIVNRKRNGFTFIEILVATAVITIVAVIAFLLINPQRNFAAARNAQRSADVLQLLNAVKQYTSEQGHTLTDLGNIPDCSTTPAAIGNGTGNIDLAGTTPTDKIVDKYIVALPMDPSNGTDSNTGYTICQNNGKVSIGAPNAERGKVISAKR